MKLSTRATRKTAFGAVAAVGLAALASGVGVSPASALAAGTLSTTSGPSGGGNALTMTIPSTATPKFASGLKVQFQPKATAQTACSAAYTTPAANPADGALNDAASPKVLSSTKIAFSVPSTVKLTGTNTTANWLVCVYPGTTGALVSNATYAIAAKPTVASISPSSAPALGGTTVTVSGTNFITGLTAKIGSVALTNISIAANGQSFTATVPAQAAATGLSVSVTTTGGSATKGNAFAYTNGIIISPTTTPTATAATDVSVQGVGFSAMDFSTTDGSTPENNKAHVILVDKDYDATGTDADSDPQTPDVKTKGAVAECLDVWVISDNELICTLNTNKAFGATGNAVPNGLYTLKVINDGSPSVTDSNAATYNADYSETILSSGSTFTVAPY